MRSIPGIGSKIAATIISVGEIDRFNHPKKLVAFASINPAFMNPGNLKRPSIESPKEVHRDFDRHFIQLFSAA